MEGGDAIWHQKENSSRQSLLLRQHIPAILRCGSLQRQEKPREVSWCPPLVHGVIMLVVVLILAPMVFSDIDAHGTPHQAAGSIMGKAYLKKPSAGSVEAAKSPPRLWCLCSRDCIGR